MNIIIGKRGTGKTTQLIRWCAEYKYALIVCHNWHMCRQVSRQAQEMGLTIPMPITYDELAKGTYRGRKIDAFLLDNAEMFLQSLTSVNIGAITMSES